MPWALMIGIMVRVNLHSVCLVDATTKVPLKEYQHQGKTWVEGKPGQEYLISVTSHDRHMSTLSYVEVDGKDIGYSAVNEPKHAGDPYLFGPISQQNLKSSLRFASMEQKDSSSTTESNSGVVKASWYEAILRPAPKETHNPGVFTLWTSTKESAPGSKKEGVGALQSQVGSSKISWDTPIASHWNDGAYLYSAEIYYCEAAGLVARGVATPQQLQLAGASGGDDPENDFENTQPTPKRHKKAQKATSTAGSVDLTASVKPEAPDEVKSSAVGIDQKPAAPGDKNTSGITVVDLTEDD